MGQKIGVVDYGFAGNIYNIKKAVESVDSGVSVFTIKDEAELAKADKVILPGVGTYKDAMKNIRAFADKLREHIRKKPTLGICLGMQIFSEKGYEVAETAGLNMLEGEVMRMQVKGRLPHLGWAELDIVQPAAILKGIGENDTFYFMHSYELINYKDVSALSRYNEHNFVSVVERDNIFGVQFHPEKSRKSGMKVFENFLNF